MAFGFFTTLISAAAANDTDNPRPRGKKLSLEPLERREVLSAGAIVDVGAQPSGALDGKIVYAHGGHGITWNGTGWGYQRPLLLDMVEDTGNQDQLTYFADSLWNAGATVVPLRPIGNQLNEVIVDNVDVGVTFTGAWSNSSSPIYFGDAGEVPYRFASTSATETATAEYRPDIPEEGFYPVYAWTRSGSDRVNQLYRVNHSGGATEVTIDHRLVGNGLVYLGTYHFESGTAGSVEISNRSDESGVVIADMIRFGNGIGSLDFGGGVSGQPRENETGLYWIQWHAENSQGVSSFEYGTSTVSAPPRYAEYMNREAGGSFSDRVFISYHSNATTGNPATATARGVLSLHNTPNGGNTPNQFLLAQTTAQEINNDLVAQNGQFEHNWANRSGSALTFSASFNYGEINNSSIQNEFDATIIETGFHDNTLDAQMLRDPRVREAIAIATTQSVVNFFNNIDGGQTPNIDAPARVDELSVETSAPGTATLNWTPPSVPLNLAGTPTGYVIYASTNGYGFDGGTFINGGGTTTHTFTNLDPNETYYFKVVARNAGGHSPDSEVVAVAPSADSERVLIVNGFDRIDRLGVPTEPFLNGLPNDRVRPRQVNSFDYAVQIAEAIDAAGGQVTVSTASNELIANGTIDLADFDAVFWISGEESTENDTFNAAEQAAVADYLAIGGDLFVSGAEIGWDLDFLNNGRSFYEQTLRGNYVADDAATYSASGEAGSIFDGIALTFDDGDQFYDVEFPDVIAPSGGSTAALRYSTGGVAGVQYADQATGERLVMLAFPFETITSAEDRTAVMAAALGFFDFDSNPPLRVSEVLDNDQGAPTYQETGSWFTLSEPGVNGGTQRLALINGTSTATWTGQIPFAGDVDVSVIYDAEFSRASGAFYTVTHPGGSFTAVVDQTTNDFTPVSLGTFTAAGPGTVTITLDVGASTGAANALVVADVVQLTTRGDAPPNGDFNDDGVVNAADYTVWRDTNGQAVTPGSGGDANFDGLVDSADYDLWLSTFGDTVAPAALTLELAAPAFASAQEAALFALPAPAFVGSPGGPDASPLAAPTGVEPTSGGPGDDEFMLLAASAATAWVYADSDARPGAHDAALEELEPVEGSDRDALGVFPEGLPHL